MDEENLDSALKCIEALCEDEKNAIIVTSIMAFLLKLHTR